MFVTKIIVFSITCFSILIAGNASAQNNSFSDAASSRCPDNFTWSNEFKLCATNAFDKPTFKKINASQACTSGYARMGSSGLCLLDDKHTRLSFKKGQLTISKGSKKKCGKNHIRLPGAKACVHKRVGLTLVNSKAKLVETNKLRCDSRNPESTSCKSKCATGYFRSPELGVCVNYEAALLSDTVLSTAKCDNPLHWRKLDSSGVCVPRMTLSIVENSAGTLVLEPGEGELPTCDEGAEIQIASMILNQPQGDSDNDTGIDTDNLVSNIQPVIYCMVRPRDPK